MKKTYIFIPPLKKTSGGLVVLYRLASFLYHKGFKVYLVCMDKPGWQPSIESNLPPIIKWSDLSLTEEDIWLIPEGWFNALLPGIQANATCYVYCQNWAYLFSALPENISWQDLPVSFIAVSHPVAEFIKDTLQVISPILRPGIDTNLFSLPDSKSSDILNIAYMPRKNSALAKQIIAIFQARTLAKQLKNKIRFFAISGLNAREVATILKKSHIFLATGFPEGCPLPPLEAMACGCLPVGFSGFGGWDYMRQALPENGYNPRLKLRPVPWQGNGLYSADGDVIDAVLNLEMAVQWWLDSSDELYKTLHAGQETIKHYTLENQKKQVIALWRNLTA